MDTPSSITSLPDDPHRLKMMIASLADQWRAKLQQVEQQAELRRQEMELKIMKLETELLRLKKRYYGPRADRLRSALEVAQMLLDFAVDLESRPVEGQAEDAGETAAGSQDDAAGRQSIRRVSRGRRNIAALENLPTVRREYDLPESEKPCPCCGELRKRIGQQSTWQIEFIPGRFERIEHVQFKYACSRCEPNGDNPQIELAEKPMQPIDKGMAGPGLIAYVITGKFCDYLPLYRMENQFSRNGFEVSRGTMCQWMRDTADICRPLYERMIQRILQSHVICTDDTIMPMLAPDKTRNTRMWVYVGDIDNPYNVFDFTLGRSRDGPKTFLGDYQQVLLADGYGGYDGVVVGNGIVRAGCWAHARRKFVEAEATSPAIAAGAVKFIKRLYAVEHEAKEMDAAQRLALRQRESQPVLNAFKERLHAWRDQLIPRHPMALAIQYTLNQWKELGVYAEDGAVPIDNNISEREMKRIVLNRKNSLFVGHERGGRTAAILSSLTSTCRRHDINPQRYLTQLLANLPATPMSQLDQWLPDRWKHNQPASGQ